jgi:hypothetical protein
VGGGGAGAAGGAGVAAGGAGVAAVGADVADAVVPAEDTPTPLPQAVRSSPAISNADSESALLRGLILCTPRLECARSFRAIVADCGLNAIQNVTGDTCHSSPMLTKHIRRQ